MASPSPIRFLNRLYDSCVTTANKSSLFRYHLLIWSIDNDFHKIFSIIFSFQGTSSTLPFPPRQESSTKGLCAETQFGTSWSSGWYFSLFFTFLKITFNNMNHPIFFTISFELRNQFKRRFSSVWYFPLSKNNFNETILLGLLYFHFSFSLYEAVLGYYFWISALD